MNELINRGVILTIRGQQLIEDAKATGRDIQLKKFGVGDGGGDAFNPTLDELKALTVVPGEWDKRNLNSVNPIESGGYTVEGLVPSDVGEGLWVRIFGIYTIDEQLMYVFLYPAWQKPQNNGNLLIELPFKATIGISDAPDFNLVIDPSLVAATQQYVLQQIESHKHDNDYYRKQHIDKTFATIADIKPNFIEHQDDDIALNKLNVFKVIKPIQLPEVTEDCICRVLVLAAVTEENKQPFTAPNGRKITVLSTGEQHETTNVVTPNVEYKFMCIDGEWMV